MTRLVPLLTLLTLASALSPSLGCGGRGDAAFGAPCQADEECAHGLCVGGVNGADPVCTKSCAGSDECPRGWSCSGVTQTQVLVCSHGAATPFGDGTE